MTIEMKEAPVGNRLTCTCGGEQFFIAGETEDSMKKDEKIDNIECTNCHKMYRLSISQKG